MTHRSRDDTVRCIVSNLIDDSCDVLSEELTKGTTDQDIIDEDNICEVKDTSLPEIIHLKECYIRVRFVTNSKLWN